MFHVFLRMETSERPDLSIVRDPDFHPCNHPCPDLRSIEFVFTDSVENEEKLTPGVRNFFKR